MMSSKSLIVNVRCSRPARIGISSSCFAVSRGAFFFARYCIGILFNSRWIVLPLDHEFSRNFSQRNSSVTIHQSFETSSLIGGDFSRAATPRIVPDEIGCAVILDDIVNSLAGNILSDKVTYGHDFLSIRDCGVMLNNALREMFSIRASYSYPEGNRKSEYPWNGRPRHRLSIERNIDHTNHRVKENRGK